MVESPFHFDLQRSDLIGGYIVAVLPWLPGSVA